MTLPPSPAAAQLKQLLENTRLFPPEDLTFQTVIQDLNAAMEFWPSGAPI